MNERVDTILHRRIQSEIKNLEKNPSSYFYAKPIENNITEWHFTIRGPENTEFQGGLYHGKIELPPTYPLNPPNFIFLTPNGRFEVNTKICLTITRFHPESWQAVWTSSLHFLYISFHG